MEDGDGATAKMVQIIVNHDNGAQFTAYTGTGDLTGDVTNVMEALDSLTNRTDATLNAYVLNGNSFGVDAYLGTNDAFPLVFETNNTERMRILSGGNVGIGTAAPTYRFEVAGGQAYINGGNVSQVASGTLASALNVRATAAPAAVMAYGVHNVITQADASAAARELRGITTSAHSIGGASTAVTGGYFNALIDATATAGAATVIGVSGDAEAYAGAAGFANTQLFIGGRFGGAGSNIGVATAVGAMMHATEAHAGMNVGGTGIARNSLGLNVGYAGFSNASDVQITGLYATLAATFPTGFNAALVAYNPGVTTHDFGIFSAAGTNYFGGFVLLNSVGAGASTDMILTRDGTGLVRQATAATMLDGAYFKNLGNSFGVNAAVGTNDNFPLAIETNDITRINIANNGTITQYADQSAVRIRSRGTATTDGMLDIVGSDTDLNYGVSMDFSTPLAASSQKTAITGFYNPGAGNIFGGDHIYGNLGGGMRDGAGNRYLAGVSGSMMNAGSMVFGGAMGYQYNDGTSAILNAGVWGMAPVAAGSYAGYFNGNVNITDNALIQGTTNLQGVVTMGSGVTNYLLPNTRGLNTQILMTDGAGNVTWQNATASLTAGMDIDFSGTSTIDIEPVLDYVQTINGPAGNDLILNSPATQDLVFQTDGGTEKMRILDGGNVGIGTAAPSYLLDVNGTARIAGASRLDGTVTMNSVAAGATSDNLLLITGAGVVRQISMDGMLDGTYFKNGGNSFGGPATVGTNDNNPLNFESNNVTYMTITPTGAVNISGNDVSTFDFNGNTLNLQTTNNGAITTGTGALTVNGPTTVTNTTNLQGVVTMGSGVTNYVMPNTRGTDGQILITDGSGNVTWQDPGVGLGQRTSQGTLTPAEMNLTATVWTDVTGVVVTPLINGNGLVLNFSGTFDDRNGTTGVQVKIRIVSDDGVGGIVAVSEEREIILMPANYYQTEVAAVNCRVLAPIAGAMTYKVQYMVVDDDYASGRITDGTLTFVQVNE